MLAGVAMTLQRWPIVGRRSELELFEQALGSAELEGLLIHGRAGVGKTRLADECRQQAAASGHPTERVVGSRTAALLPLGAVAALLAGGFGRPGPDGQVHPVALLEETRRALRERHHGRRLVVVADDAALLDAASLALLEYLAAQRTIFLIATVRAGDPVPDLLTGLWRDRRLERVDLHDLSRTHLDTMLHLTLGGPIEAGAARQFWELTRGNPLYVHELVLAAIESGALVERSGVWHLEDRLPATSRLLVATLQGRVATARRYYAEAAGLAEANRFAGPRSVVLSGLALAHAMLGDADAAARVLAERAARPAFGFLGPEQQLADAWTALASRRPAAAADIFRAAAAQAAATGHRTAESWLWHDLMRTSGYDASARLRELAAACDSPLVTARARNAAAARARDGKELAAAAGDFEALGAMLLAAEAAAAAAEAFSRAGDRRAATAAQRRSSALAAACENAATPGLAHAAVPVPLSGREREIVLLAATGMASKDIADRLFLSARTVNNHLQHAYAKLGVSSRAGLAQALGST